MDNGALMKLLCKWNGISQTICALLRFPNVKFPGTESLYSEGIACVGCSAALKWTHYLVSKYISASLLHGN